MQKQARHTQYMAFRAVAEKANMNFVRQADIRSRATIDTDGAQEQLTAGAEWKQNFFAEADSVNALALRTTEPAIPHNKAIPDEYMLGFRAVSAYINQQTTTFTVTELMEICFKLSLGVLQIKSGQHVHYERNLGQLLGGVLGVEVREDGTNAAAGTPNITARGRITGMDEGDDLDDALVVLPGGSFGVFVFGEGAWTTTDDILLELMLHGWIASQGKEAETARVAGLNQLYHEATSDVARLASRLA